VRTHPLTILDLPSAGYGALLTLIFKTELVCMFVGVIMLGAGKKNGIMMVDFAVAPSRITRRRASHPRSASVRSARS
jgi:HAE1 family hydrophobic/amphiphilic exporter-1